jgi:hypothetical protein
MLYQEPGSLGMYPLASDLARRSDRLTTTLKPQSLASWKELHTACTVWPRFVSRATSS